MEVKSKEKKEEVSCYLAVSNLERDYHNRKAVLNQTFKGEVDDKPVMFPRGLGAQHPFNFQQVDTILDNVGIANAMVDKITDAIVGDFSVRVDDDNAQTLLDEFVRDSKMKSKLRPWIKEAVGKGNGFMELDLNDIKNIERIRVNNANGMYVKRNKKGKVMEYNQFKGNFKTIINKDKIIPFKPAEIAHLTINKTPNDPYGQGLVWSNRVTIENFAGSEVDRHKVLSRKAGAPYHVKLGQPGQKVKKADLDSFKSELQYQDISTEWVTDANVDIKALDFAGVGDNLTKSSEYDLELLSLGMKIPMSILGISNNPEGLAKVNDKGFLQFIGSVRGQVEEVLEEQVLRPFLRMQSPKLDAEVEFDWELPGEVEKNERLTKIIDTLKLMDLSPEMRAALEREYAEVMGLVEIVDLLPTPEEARKKADEEEAEMKKQEDEARKAEEENIKQPEVPGAKKTANQTAQNDIKEVKKGDLVVKSTAQHDNCSECNLTEAELGNMTIAKFVNLKELAGFNYSDYLVKILQALRTDKFEDLLALTEMDITEGLLPQRDINKLRIVLKDGFRKNRTIRQIENEIDRSINLKDRVKIQEDGSKKLTQSASTRPVTIARTETVRLANQGLKDMYIENDITSYRYLAALDDRTSAICTDLNGQVFLTKDGTPGVNMPPMHVNCRSSIVGLVD